MRSNSKLKDLYEHYLGAYNMHLIITPTTHLPKAFSALLLLSGFIPKLKDLYDRYLDAYNVQLTITPTTHLPAGPIDQVQPWVLYK